jgi:glycosyltransferase involved in cell wall biosynthesis
VGDIFGPESMTMEAETRRLQQRQEAERVRKLLELGEKFAWKKEQIDAVLQWVRDDVLDSEDVKTPSYPVIPSSYDEAMQLIESSGLMLRKKCAAFAHSFERNGANNFLLYLVRELRGILEFSVYSPKKGPMWDDFQSIGAEPYLFDPRDQKALAETLSHYDCCLANTIMQAPVILAASQIQLTNVWVIHEAWPKDQIEYYCKQVFLMEHLDTQVIMEAFRKADKIVFPAKVQENCYEGLFEPPKASVIYNGIPLTAINAFRATQSRNRTRAELGFSSNDILLLHMGTVCKRKGQLITAKAFSLLKNDPEVCLLLEYFLFAASKMELDSSHATQFEAFDGWCTIYSTT